LAVKKVGIEIVLGNRKQPNIIKIGIEIIT